MITSIPSRMKKKDASATPGEAQQLLAQPGLKEVSAKRSRGRQPDPNGKEKVLSAAATAFMERGYSGTSIDDIANVLGVTKGYVYHHFTSKSELYFGVLEAGLTHIDQMVRPTFEGALELKPKLQLMAQQHVMAILMNFPTSKVGVQGLEKSLMNATGVQARRELRRIIRMRDEYEKMFTTTIDEGMQAGIFRESHLGLSVKGFLGALNWITVWFDPSRNTTAAQMEEMSRQLADFSIQALRR